MSITLTYDQLVKVLTAVQRVADDMNTFSLYSLSHEYQELHDNIMAQAAQGAQS